MKNFLLLFIPFLLLSACDRSDIDPIDDVVVEGQSVTISLQVDMAQLQTRAGLSAAQQQQINSIFVLVFDKHGIKVSSQYITSNIASSLTNIATVSGSNMSVYVFTNLTVQNTASAVVGNFFNTVYTVDALMAVNLVNLAADLNLNRSLVMFGSATGLTFAATTTNHATVQLNYATAKVTLYVVKALTTPSDVYTMTNWTVINYPVKSRLVGQSTDAVVGGNAADYSSSATSIVWVDTMLIINSVATPAQYACLYMYENRRGTNSNTLETQKASNPPPSSTAIVLQGYYKTTATNTVTGVTSTVYLGANNKNDYNVYRGNDYSYIVTVKSISQINIDSRVVSNSAGYQVSLFNPTLDNHPDWRPIQVSSWPGTATIGTYDADGVTPCSWLKVSTINLNQAVGNHRPTYSPSADMLNSLTLTFPASTSIASKSSYLYATENTTLVRRYAVVKVVYTTPSLGSQTITLNVSQLGYQTMGAYAGFRSYVISIAGLVTLGSDYTLVVENIEESSLNLTPGAEAGSEALATMQWGFNKTVTQSAELLTPIDFYYRNGDLNTLWLVYGDYVGTTSSTLRPPYGRLSAANAPTTSVQITENEMNPIFNTYPARYCFEKNRDANGDGKIAGSEIVWYLPSADELYGMYVGQYALINMLNGANYHASTEVNSTSTNSMIHNSGLNISIDKSMAVNVRCVRRLYNTAPAGAKNSPYVETLSTVVNNHGFASSILRTSELDCPVPIHTNSSAISHKISPRFKVALADCRISATQAGLTMTWSQANGWTSVSNSSNAEGVVVSPATGCQFYSEVGHPAGTWRLPTQREMYNMFTLRNEFGSIGYTPLLSSAYWTSTAMGATSAWYAVFGGGNNIIVFGDKTNAARVRCVTDHIADG